MKSLFAVTALALSLLNPLPKIHAMESPVLSHKDIMEGIASMNLSEAQKFCATLSESRNFIEANLTNLSKGNLDLSIPTLLRIFSSSDDYKELREFELLSIEGRPLTIEKYLQFKMAMKPKSHMSCSSSSYDSESLTKFQSDLEIKVTTSENNLRRIIGQIGEALKNPLDLDPYHICCFNTAFNELRQNSLPLIDLPSPTEDLTYRNIADKFISMNHEEMSFFSQKVFEAKNAIRQALTPHSNSSSSAAYSYWDRPKDIEKAQNLLQAFHTFPKELSQISNLTIWQFNKGAMTFETYLQFCIDLHPDLKDQNWIPFYQKTNYANIERILKCLGLHSNSQYNKEVRELVKNVQSDLDNPFFLDPLAISVLASHFNTLKKQSEKFKFLKSDEEKTEDFIRNKGLYIANFIFIGGLCYVGKYWYV